MKSKFDLYLKFQSRKVALTVLNTPHMPTGYENILPKLRTWLPVFHAHWKQTVYQVLRLDLCTVKAKDTNQ
ncbi:hypothetical protein M8C21_006838 [Ambrosia artemisiifolia]|uniref:Uncharacterized protein n=1 Tax=Ambrosia artemisiifolia TaxID=4212 RepID=A0AAD5D7B9_AMBAR|nr:hypothetical protein M8C21_006838 [Ambrosia artemisiifolia]